MIPRRMFELLRSALVALTGHGYDRADWLNDLHHKLAFRLHKRLASFGITGIQRVPVPGMRIAHDASDHFMYVRAEDGGVAHQLIMYRQYEPFESQLVRERLTPGMIVYNIGANLGYYSLVASKQVGPDGKVFAFEPEPGNVELLRRTVSGNRLTNVEILSMAVASESGSATLSLSATNSGDHRLTDIPSRDHVVVPVTSVDAFIAAGHPAPNAIIMDVQGAELDVLRGAQSVLATSAPLLLFTEFWPQGLDERHNNGTREMLEILERAGFRPHRIDEKRRRLTETSRDDLLNNVKGNAEANLLCVR